MNENLQDGNFFKPYFVDQRQPLPSDPYNPMDPFGPFKPINPWKKRPIPERLNA